jgi:branched-chain amino acid transport system permease protein
MSDSPVVRWIRNTGTPMLGPPVVAALATLVALVTGSSVLETVCLAALVNLVLTIGLYSFSGLSGILVFGQMSFMAIGAYTSGLVTTPSSFKHSTLPHLPHWLGALELGVIPGTLVAGAVAGILALLIGKPLMRLSGVSAGIASLALLLITQTVIENWASVTRGTQSMIGIPTDIGPWEVVAWATVIAVGVFAYQTSGAGLRLRASREDELSAIAAGIRVERERLIAFTLSGFICGIGGSLYAHYLGALTPTLSFFFTPTVLIIAMLVIGGYRSLWGAFVGTLVVSIISELLRRVEQGVSIGPLHLSTKPGLDGIILGIIMLLILILKPSGITGGRELRWPTQMPRIGRPSGGLRFRRTTSPNVDDPVISDS